MNYNVVYFLAGMATMLLLTYMWACACRSVDNQLPYYGKPSMVSLPKRNRRILKRRK